MKLVVVAFVSSLSVLAAPPSAQQKLDLSGAWVIVPGSGQPNGVGGLGREFTAVQDEKALTITTTQPIVGEMKLVYRLDHQPSSNALAMGAIKADRVSTVSWEGRTLVITSTVTMRGLTAKTTQVLWLDNGELVTEQVSEQGGRKETTRARYRRK